MLSVSSTFLAAIRGAYVGLTTVDVYYNRNLVAANLPVVDGSATVDRTSTTRRSGSVTIGDPTFFPTFANSPLAPYGAELNIKSGIQYPNGSQELVSIGWFRIQDVYQEKSPEQSNGLLPVVDFCDRSQGIQDAGFLDPIDRGGWDIQRCLTGLIQDVMPWAKVNFANGLGTGTIPGGTVFDSDRWGAVQALAGYLGAEAFFDANGVVQVVPIPALTQSTPASSAVWTVDASTPAAVSAGGSKSGVMAAAKRTVSRTGVFNCVAAYGSATGSGSPPVGYACDTDPRSPTYYGPSATGAPQGAFGASVYRYTNSILTTVSQANAAAAAQLNNYLGLARSLEFTSLPNPALEAGDIINVIYPDGKTELHIMDSFTLPFGKSAQFTGTTRTLTYQTAGGT